MRSFADRLKSRLEAKYLLSEKMKSILTEQKALLENGDIFDFNCRCGAVDSLVDSLKGLDYDIARLESMVDGDGSAGLARRDKELRDLVNKTAGVTARNRSLIEELASCLTRSGIEIGALLRNQVQQVGQKLDTAQPASRSTLKKETKVL